MSLHYLVKLKNAHRARATIELLKNKLQNLFHHNCGLQIPACGNTAREGVQNTHHWSEPIHDAIDEYGCHNDGVIQLGLHRSHAVVVSNFITHKIAFSFQANHPRTRLCFQSCGKDDDHHAVRSVTSATENPILHANFMHASLSSITVLPIELLHCRNREFCAFLLLWPWPEDLHIRTWPLYPEVSPQTKNELSTSRLSN